jgi:thiosulfate/3-mercaptopyruvate sulfurtransferase
MLVSTEWLSAHLDDRRTSILHVGRDRASYDAGHIPGARFVALGDLVVARDGLPNELPPASQLARVFEKLGVGDEGRIVVYGDGRGLFAARVFFTLDYLGHGDRVALLDGGLEQWRAERRPVTTEGTPVRGQSFVARVDPDVLVTLPAVRDISWGIARSNDRTLALIDARPAAEYSGERPGEGIARGGHIPGAAGIFWERLLVSPDTPVLRPASELQQMLDEAGVRPGARVVTYCRTGVQASFAYFAARYLGYSVKMYDGSFIEWSGAPGTDVVR